MCSALSESFLSKGFLFFGDELSIGCCSNFIGRSLIDSGEEMLCMSYDICRLISSGDKAILSWVTNRAIIAIALTSARARMHLSFVVNLVPLSGRIALMLIAKCVICKSCVRSISKFLFVCVCFFVWLPNKFWEWDPCYLLSWMGIRQKGLTSFMIAEKLNGDKEVSHTARKSARWGISVGRT